MALTEILAIVVCGAIGYGLISYMWPSVRGDTSASGTAQPGRETMPPRTGEPSRWFVVLGIPETATSEEITRAYRKLISQYHPDKVAQMGAEIRQLAETKSQQINLAYEEGIALRRLGG